MALFKMKACIFENCFQGSKLKKKTVSKRLWFVLNRDKTAILDIQYLLLAQYSFYSISKY